jgi:hypothetical protein
LPASFVFVLDEVADGGAVVGVQWHVERIKPGEASGTPLPFARGCSVYKADPATGLITSGFDVPEPAPLKPGSAGQRAWASARKEGGGPCAEPLYAATRNERPQSENPYAPHADLGPLASRFHG